MVSHLFIFSLLVGSPAEIIVLPQEITELYPWQDTHLEAKLLLFIFIIFLLNKISPISYYLYCLSPVARLINFMSF
jgi:hypothetical protein